MDPRPETGLTLRELVLEMRGDIKELRHDVDDLKDYNIAQTDARTATARVYTRFGQFGGKFANYTILGIQVAIALWVATGGKVI